MSRIISILCCCAFLFACQSSSQNSEATENAEASAPAETPKPADTATQATAESLPSLPIELLKDLWETCDYVDYVFYYFNFSMSQDEQASIRSTLRQISEEQAVLNPNCKAIGRLFYQVEGENVLEADLHLSNECAYFLFYKDGKKAYANKLTAEGLKFYQNIFNQVQKNSQGQ